MKLPGKGRGAFLFLGQREEGVGLGLGSIFIEVGVIERGLFQTKVELQY